MTETHRTEREGGGMISSTLKQVTRTLDERKAERFIVNYVNKSSAREVLRITDCQFHDIPQTDTCHFSLTQLDDSDGFDVQMQGIIVVPATHLIIRKLPRFATWILKKLFDTVGGNPL